MILYSVQGYCLRDGLNIRLFFPADCDRFVPQNGPHRIREILGNSAFENSL